MSIINDCLVTGVVTTYKRPVEFVLRAVNSILNQSYKNIEVIVVNDSPKDFEGKETLRKALDKLSDKVLYIEHEDSRGACAARNTGLTNAHGKYIGFLDDDDEWLPNKLEVMLPLFSSDSVGLVYCGSICRIVGTQQEFPFIKEFYSGYIFDKLIYHNFIGSTSFPILKTEYVRKVGGFDVLQRASQDHDLWLRVSQISEIRYTKEDLVYYYIHENEQISKNHKNKISGYERLIEKNKAYLDDHPKALANREAILVTEYSADGEKSKALKTFFSMLSHDPFNVNQIIKAIKHLVL